MFQYFHIGNRTLGLVPSYKLYIIYNYININYYYYDFRIFNRLYYNFPFILYSDKWNRNNGVNYVDKILDRLITSLY